MKLASCLTLLTFLILLFSVIPASAQTPAPRSVTDDEVNAVARQLYCPVCENIPLDVCPTQACADWREEVRLKLSQGWSEAQIKQYFVDRFGARVLATPPARGINWLVYIVPPVLILVGIYLLFGAFKAWKASSPPLAAKQASDAREVESAPADEYVARLEEQLRKTDQ